MEEKKVGTETSESLEVAATHGERHLSVQHFSLRLSFEARDVAGFSGPSELVLELMQLIRQSCRDLLAKHPSASDVLFFGWIAARGPGIPFEILTLVADAIREALRDLLSSNDSALSINLSAPAPEQAQRTFRDQQNRFEITAAFHSPFQTFTPTDQLTLASSLLPVLSPFFQSATTEIIDSLPPGKRPLLSRIFMQFQKGCRLVVLDEITRLMSEDNISQAQLARTLGQSRSSVSRWLNNRNLTHERLSALAQLTPFQDRLPDSREQFLAGLRNAMLWTKKQVLSESTKTRRSLGHQEFECLFNATSAGWVPGADVNIAYRALQKGIHSDHFIQPRDFEALFQAWAKPWSITVFVLRDKNYFDSLDREPISVAHYVPQLESEPPPTPAHIHKSLTSAEAGSKPYPLIEIDVFRIGAKRIIKAKGLTYSEIGRRLGFEDRTKANNAISWLLNTSKNPPLLRILQFSNAIGASVDQIMASGLSRPQE